MPQLLVLLLKRQIWQLFQKYRSFFKFKFNRPYKPCNIFIFGQTKWRPEAGKQNQDGYL
ncbi:hypothetical protein AQPE_0990 [Aquipluma nitroreducens]|uniref:Uncharacterized protein n=1 Tax=Aquipluma nitroreducens TaxID=2010828 RepID=A0A5K7S5M8_9BACT|nr:hypothetical protein AQPE_0990 [Aquipluma nitroreducens]